MTLRIRYFKNPYIEGYSPNQKGESSNQINKTKILIKNTLRNGVLEHVQGYMTAKTLFKIKSPLMINFISDLIENLKNKEGTSQAKHLIQIHELKKIKKELNNVEEHDLTILRLPILNKKNPLIQILISLDDDAIKRLKSISPPPFFPDFFETLSFHTDLNRIHKLKNSAERIQRLILFSNDLIDQNNPSRSIQALIMAKKIANKHYIKFSEKINLFRKIAEAFFLLGEKNGAVATLTDGIEFVSENSPTEKQQVLYFEQISLDLIHFQAWDLLNQLFNVFTSSHHLKLKERSKAFNRVFQYIFDNLEFNQGLTILYGLKDSIEKDLLIEQLADNASSHPEWIHDAILMLKKIKNPEIQSRAMQMVSERLPVESSQELEG